MNIPKALIAILFAAANLTGHAQGTITFANSASTLVSFGGPGVTATPVPAGSVTVGLYYSATPNDNNIADFNLIATATTGPVAGRYSDPNTVVTPNSTAPGGQASFIVRAWTGGYASYDAAITGFNAGDRSVGVGQSQFFNVTTGGGGTPAAPPSPTTANAFTIFVSPEPSTIALAALGGLAVFCCHRKRAIRH